MDLLLAGVEGAIPEPLRPVAQAIKTMPRANSGMTWLQSPAVRKLLRQLGTGEVGLTHEALDGLPASRRVEYLRGLLVEHHVLSPRDPHLAAYRRWLGAKLATIEDAEHRRLVEMFGRWHHLRRLERQAARDGAVAENTLLRVKQSTTSAVAFLAWLAGRCRTLSEATQHDVDAWFSAGPTTRFHTVPFLYWAMRSRHLCRVRVPRQQARSHPALGGDQRLEALRGLLLDDAIPSPGGSPAASSCCTGRPPSGSPGSGSTTSRCSPTAGHGCASPRTG